MPRYILVYEAAREPGTEIEFFGIEGELERRVNELSNIHQNDLNIKVCGWLNIEFDLMPKQYATKIELVRKQ